MTTLQPRPVSTASLTLFFTGILIAGVAFVWALVWAVETWFGISFENSAMGLILVFCAASATGQFWYSREQEKPASGRVWTVSAVCLLITLVLQAAIIAAIVVLMGEEADIGQLRGSDQQILAIAAFAIVVLELLVIRLGLGFGIRQAAKAAAFRAAKTGS
jgi:hypothetical protein